MQKRCKSVAKNKLFQKSFHKTQIHVKFKKDKNLKNIFYKFINKIKIQRLELILNPITLKGILWGAYRAQN
jgi:hypothetical protein